MELAHFPFDRQLLHATFQHASKEQPDLKVTWDKDMVPSFEYLCADGEWDPPNDSTPPVELFWAEGEDTSQLEVVGRVQRKSIFFFWNIVFMVFLIVGTSFVSFAIPPSDGGTRLGLNITLLLTAVSFKNVVCSYLPKTTYVTRIDYYILASFLVLIAMIIENSVAQVVGDPYDALIDLVAECVCIAGWCLFNLVIFVLFLVDNRKLATPMRDRWSQVEEDQSRDKATPIRNLPVMTPALRKRKAEEAKAKEKAKGAASATAPPTHQVKSKST
eukprot:TRINITY_DN1084_c0_g1_i1.p1 TRINITY_DN1084_c0_g1~~TRINITY_DN1084_c0_g1_i1.p1  ORF type:complete len:273 (+),score=72.06 TRINITY_DN1084_c0_g1_i1:592-1410(+)